MSLSVIAGSVGSLVAIEAGIAIYATVTLWALAETIRRRRWGWLIALWALGPIGLIGWLGFGRRKLDR